MHHAADGLDEAATEVQLVVELWRVETINVWLASQGKAPADQLSVVPRS